MLELSKHNQYLPLPVEYQVIIAYAGMRGNLDRIDISQISKLERSGENGRVL